MRIFLGAKTPLQLAWAIDFLTNSSKSLEFPSYCYNLQYKVTVLQVTALHVPGEKWQVKSDRWLLTGDKCQVISDSFINYSLKVMINDKNIDERYSLLICLFNMDQLSSSGVSIQDFVE